jgi:CHAT domain-containing protein
MTLLRFSLIFFIFSQATLAEPQAEWEKILKDDAPAAGTKDAGKRGWTYGLQIDAFSRIESTGTTDWQDILRKDERAKDITLNDTPEVRELIDKMAEADARTDDKSREKSDLISTFGLVFADIGDFSRAQQLCLRGFKLAELNTGPESDETLRSMGRVGRLFLMMGDYERVQMIAEDALAACAVNKTSGQRVEPLFLALRSVAEAGRGFYKDALVSGSAAVEKARQTDGCSPAVLATALTALAQHERMKGDYATAEQLLREAIKAADRASEEDAQPDVRIIPESTAAKATALQSLGELQLSIGDTAGLEKTAAELQGCLTNKAGVYTPGQAKLALLRAASASRKGDAASARKYGREYLEYVDQTLPAALGMVESQRLGWQKSYLNYAVPVAFCGPDELANHVLTWKGVVLDSMIGDRKNLGLHKTEAAIQWSKELTDCRQKLLQVSMSKTGKGDQTVQELKNRIFFLERKIADETRNFFNESAQGATAAEVKKVLAPEEVLVEFIVYRDISDPVLGDPQLGAVVLVHDKPAVWVPLGSESAVGQMIRNLQKTISSRRDESESLRVSLTAIYEKLWAKVQAAFPAETRTVYVSPDGPLNFVPFACLLDPAGHFVGEGSNIVYVGSGRDLLAKSSPPVNKTVKIFADPDFGKQFASGAPATMAQPSERSIAQSEFDRVSLPALPGTAREAKILGDVATRSGWSPNVAVGDKASEKALSGSSTPGILHLATHGFYLGGNSALAADQSMRGMAVKQAVDPGAGAVNLPELSPMIQSGIALSGALNTLSLWSKGQAPEPANDGILTALDVAGLDLKGTWLVTLSACETGVGDARSGEGVFGLKRAFMMAGAQNLLMTLWPVSDETTPEIMGDFYRQAFASENAPAAFSQTQRAWLNRLKREKGLHAAVREAGPFAMVAMANPRLKTSVAAFSDTETLKQKREEARRRQQAMPEQKDFDRLDKLFE